ncbi:MAG: DUF3575 domain-containing protein [Alistipes sp.]
MKQTLFFLLLLAALCIAPHRITAQVFAVRANALAALTGTAAVGVEVSLADKWTVEVSGYWNPIRTNNLSTRFYAVQVGSCYWLYESFVGHFLGQHLIYVDYNIGNRIRHYRGRAYGLGISYGYAWMLSKRWNVAVEAGAGIYHTRDTRRDPTVGDWEDETIYHSRRWTLAPSKVEVAFSYLF